METSDDIGKADSEGGKFPFQIGGDAVLVQVVA